MPSWLAAIPPADLLNAAVNGLGIFIAFVAGAVVGPWLNARRARVEAKERVLRTLLNTRVDVGHQDFSAAISLIPLEFVKSKPVKSAHAKYLAATNRVSNNEAEKAANNIETSNRLDDLISSIAANIGLDITGHEGYKYLSGAYVERGQLQERSWIAMIRIANALERAEERGQATSLPPSDARTAEAPPAPDLNERPPVEPTRLAVSRD
jgi:hypothetical protein